ncbi:MAG TPA: glycosyltransferase [Candidatus Polarisedimenticolia bacterium]|nr:glycosyltransferase [Candidatus Polarisedimenticolia bacterium]
MVAKRPRSILFICDFNSPGGTQTHLLHLFAGLDRSRFVPSLAALTVHPDLRRRLEEVNVEVTDLALREAVSLRTWRAARGLAARARTSADLIHGYLFHGSVLAAAVSVMSGVTCLTSERNLDLRRSRRRRWCGARAHRRAARVLFNSRRVRDAVIARDGIPSGRAVVIPNGVPDLAAGPSAGDPVAGLPAGTGPLIVCVASLRHKKGHEFLLDAFEHVRVRVPSARLALVGDGPLRGELEARVREAGLADAVQFIGHRGNVAAILRSADLFVLSSLEEGMPNALLEAMAAGLPSVTTDSGGCPEVIEEGVSGFIVPAGRSGPFAERMMALLADEGLRRRMGEAARKRFETTYTVDRMLAAYHALYEEVLG